MLEAAAHRCLRPLQQPRRQHAGSAATSASQGCLRHKQQQQQQQRQQQRCFGAPSPTSCRALPMLLLLLGCVLALSALQPVAAAPSPAPAGLPAAAAAAATAAAAAAAAPAGLPAAAAAAAAPAGPPAAAAAAATAAVVAAAPPDVPRLELQKWNQAFRMHMSLITLAQQQEYEIINMGKCSSEGFDSTDPASVPLEACFFKQYANGSYAYWIKKPGDWRTNSNCYCYALNVYKGGFCIPGGSNLLSSGSAGVPATPSCDVIRAAALADGARLVPRQTALTTQPASGHYIGLLARAAACNPYHCWREDFHAIRKDATGFWSWKEPGGPASDADLFGNKISDPQGARLPGNYDQWCGFFWVDPANMSIGGNFREDYRVAAMAGYYEQLLGAPVTLTPSPYNQTVDGAFDSWAAKGYADDLIWELKRGTRNWDAFYASSGSAPQLNPSLALQGGPAGAAAAAAAAQRNIGGPRNVDGPQPSARTNMGLPAQPVVQRRANVPSAAAAAAVLRPAPRTNMGTSGAVRPAGGGSSSMPAAAGAATLRQNPIAGSRGSTALLSVASPPPAAAAASSGSGSAGSSRMGGAGTNSATTSRAAAVAATAAANRVYSMAAPSQGAASSGGSAAGDRAGSRRLLVSQRV
ncbi:hypothetical protein COO60DRAFT_1207305 [Scenedesmus sp. NREL 46B-D3]|nr:hypothetical protein COO60DRAFT_1207305 [Scenedesmus sp. NREL 46B-D3]